MDKASPPYTSFDLMAPPEVISAWLEDMHVVSHACKNPCQCCLSAWAQPQLLIAGTINSIESSPRPKRPRLRYHKRQPLGTMSTNSQNVVRRTNLRRGVSTQKGLASGRGLPPATQSSPWWGYKHIVQTERPFDSWVRGLMCCGRRQCAEEQQSFRALQLR